MKHARIATILLTISFLLLLMRPGRAEEPQRPDVYKLLDSEDEAKISEVVHLTPEEAFERLKGIDFLIKEDLLHKAIFETYKYRKAEGIKLAFRYLTLPQREIIDGKVVDRTEYFYVAKKFLEVFPDESVSKLLGLYRRGNGMVQGNVIRASGKISGEAIKQLLVMALDNKIYSEEETPEMEGIPLRVCDEAYNQLVLRYVVKDVLRTIGNGFTLEVRDYHIEVLKEKLALLYGLQHR